MVVEGLPQYAPFHPTSPHLRQANSREIAAFLQKTYSQKIPLRQNLAPCIVRKKRRCSNSATGKGAVSMKVHGRLLTKRARKSSPQWRRILPVSPGSEIKKNSATWRRLCWAERRNPSRTWRGRLDLSHRVLRACSRRGWLMRAQPDLTAAVRVMVDKIDASIPKEYQGESCEQSSRN